MRSAPVYCDACGAPNRSQARFCAACGLVLPLVVASAKQSAFQQDSTTEPDASLEPEAWEGPDMSGRGAGVKQNAGAARMPSRLLKRRYRLQAELGAGGMGAVYRAEDTQFGNRVVAVKEMSQQGMSPREVREAADIFKQEAYLLASLMHPHLPRIYDYFSDAGNFYLVMDYIEGETLAEYQKRVSKAGQSRQERQERQERQAGQGRLPLEEVLDIGIQLCTVLDYLHTRQPPIVFRDLKPANVMRTSDGNLYLIDFGIARHFKPGKAQDTNAFISPGYAAPEQFGVEQTTPRSDIYSLGALLHHFLSGRHPAHNTPTMFDFPPLQTQAAQPSPIPPALAALVMRMVDTNLNNRPASMAVVKQELQRIAQRRQEWQPSQGQQGQQGQQPPQRSQGQPVATRSFVGQQSNVPEAGRPTAEIAPTGQDQAQAAVGALLCTYRDHAQVVNALSWSPHDRRIASAGANRAHVWNTTTGASTLIYTGHASKVNAVAWQPNAQIVASAGADKTVQLWNPNTGAQTFVYRGHTGPISAVTWSPDGRYIASAGIGRVHLWEASTGHLLLTYVNHSGKINALAWSADGQRIASTGEDTTVQVWQAATGRTLVTYSGHSHAVKTLAWSPDGTQMASGGAGRVHVWETTTGRDSFTYNEHAQGVLTLAWSPDGRYIASGGASRVHIWQATNGQDALTYSGHSRPITALNWSHNGQRLASASEDTTIQVWKPPM